MADGWPIRWITKAEARKLWPDAPKHLKPEPLGIAVEFPQPSFNVFRVL